MKTIHAQRILLILFLNLFLAILPSQDILADAGPHPSMQFVFTSQIKPAPTILSGQLEECEDAACVASAPLQEMGPQRFTCQASSCYSSGYDYSPYHRLEIEFSDGITRQSNIFTKEAYFANYLVTTLADSLQVKEEPLGPNIPFFQVHGPRLNDVIATFVFPCMEIVLPVILLVLASKTGRAGAKFSSTRGWFIAAWILAIPATLAGIQWTRGLIITLIVELLMGLGYTLWRKHPPLVMLTVILLMNLVTQPILWISLSSLSGITPLVGLIFAEIVVWLSEAGILYMSQRASMRFSEALLVSLSLNATSFIAGMFLPI